MLNFQSLYLYYCLFFLSQNFIFVRGIIGRILRTPWEFGLAPGAAPSTSRKRKSAAAAKVRYNLRLVATVLYELIRRVQVIYDRVV